MKPIVSDSPDDRDSRPRPLSTSRRRFLAMTLGLGLEPSLIGSIPVRRAGRPCAPEMYHPFSPARTVILPGGLGRPHIPARRVIERRVEELAAMELRRLPEPKIDALLQVVVAVTSHYGLADQLQEWAERIPGQEAFAPCSCQHAGVLNQWLPRVPVRGARSQVDWWLFLSRTPIEWQSLDDLPIHALIAHVASDDYHPQSDDYHRQMTAIFHAWKQTLDLIELVAESELPWPAVARMRPVAAVRYLNAIASRNGKQDA